MSNVVYFNKIYDKSVATLKKLLLKKLRDNQNKTVKDEKTREVDIFLLCEHAGSDASILFRAFLEGRGTKAEKEYATFIITFLEALYRSEFTQLAWYNSRLTNVSNVMSSVDIKAKEPGNAQKIALFAQTLSSETEPYSPELYKRILESLISIYTDCPDTKFTPGHSNFASACYVVAEKFDLHLSQPTMEKLIYGANFPAHHSCCFFQRGAENPQRNAALAKFIKDEPAPSVGITATI